MTEKELIKCYKDYKTNYYEFCAYIEERKTSNNMKHYATFIKMRFAMKTIIECFEKYAKEEGIKL